MASMVGISVGNFRQNSALFKKFKRSEDGVVAVLVAVLMVLLIVFAGMAIDFGMGFNTRRAVNQALDAAVLAAANKLSTTELTTTQVNNLIGQYFEQNLKNSIGHDVDHTKPVVLYDTKGDTVSATATATIKTKFLPILKLISSEAGNLEEFTVASSSTARFPKTKVEVAVVVDVTGSMSGSVQSLRKASMNLLDTLLPADNAKLKNRVRISYVPYSEGVKLSKTLAEKATFEKNAYGCVHARVGDLKYSGKNHDYEDEDDDERVDYIGTNKNRCAKAQMVPLTSDRTKIESSIKALSARGGTAGQIGIAWGWYTLSPEWRDFWTAAPEEYGKNGVRKYAVLMTDGEFNRYYSADYTEAEKQLVKILEDKGDVQNTQDPMAGGKLDEADHKLIASKVKWRFRIDGELDGVPFKTASKLCANMKEEGIIIYTVFYGSRNNGKEIMEECASSESTFYYAISQSDLIRAFSSIANDIKKIYLSE